MQRLILFLCFCLGSGTLPLYGTQLCGRIFDAQSRVPLESAIIQLIGTEKGSLSDQDGRFCLESLPQGSYPIRISYLGYEPFIDTIQFQSTNKLEIEIALQPGQLELAAVQIQAQSDPDLSLKQINSLDLGLRSVQSSQELLRIIPGLFIAQHAGGGKAEQIFMRGFDLDHGTDIALSVDGLPVNMVSHAHGQAYADLHFLIPELIQGVSFSKGPHDASYGNFATTGAVDFRTLESLPESSLRLEAGQFGHFRGLTMLDLSPGKKQQQAYFAAEYQTMQGYFESPQDYSRLNLFGRYGIQIGKQDHLQLSMSSFGSSWRASGQIPLRAVEQGIISRWGAIDDTEGGKTSRRQIMLRHRHRSTKPGQLFEQKAYWVQYDFSLFSNFSFFLEDSIHGDQIHQQEARDLFGYQTRYQDITSLLGQTVRIESGFQLRADMIRDNELSHTRGRTEVLQRLALGNIFETKAGTYFKVQIPFSRSWQLEAALRYDLFRFTYQNQLEQPQSTAQNEAKGRLSPKLQLSYFDEKLGQISLKTSMGFHSNDSRLILAQIDGQALPRAYGIDLSWTHKPFSRLLLQTTFWSLFLEQELIYVGDAAIVESRDQTFRYGLEATLRYQLGDNFFADTDFSYSIARLLQAPRGQNYLPLAPVFNSTGGLNYLYKDLWKARLGYRWLGDRPANEDFSLVATGYFLLDAKVSYRWRAWEISLAANNLLNTAWREAQFETESRLKGETKPFTEIHFTPGSPFFLKVGVSVFW